MNVNEVDSATLLHRMVNAVETVRDRLVRATGALTKQGVPYAVVGGNAVAAWVATVEQAAVRNTQDVDVLLERSDFGAAKAALEAAGFVHQNVAGVDLFLDDADASPKSAVHIVFGRDVVRPGEPEPNPGVDESTDLGPFRVLNLEALVRIKLTANRDKDRTHVRDMIGVGLVDQSWVGRLPSALGERLQGILDDPDG
jgi:hypothetical protein